MEHTLSSPSALSAAHSQRATAWRVAIAGMVALSVAMGIGRFAFTPILPMMLHDGSLTLAQGSWLATGNYLGYFVGALACMAVRGDAARLIRIGLVATVLLTADPAVARRMSLVWGIRSLIDREVTDHDTVPIMAEEAVRRLGIGDEQDSIVVVCGFPFGVPGTTNSIRVTPLGRKDIPCFLAAMTLEFYERFTRAAKA